MSFQKTTTEKLIDSIEFEIERLKKEKQKTMSYSSTELAAKEIAISNFYIALAHLIK